MGFVRELCRPLAAAAWHAQPEVDALRLRSASTHNLWADVSVLIPDVDYGRENVSVKHKRASVVKIFCARAHVRAATSRVCARRAARSGCRRSRSAAARSHRRILRPRSALMRVPGARASR